MTILKYCCAIATALVLSHTVVYAAPREGNGNAPKDFKVVGYWASWRGSANALDYDGLTHINFSFAVPKADGKVELRGNPASLRKMVTRAHAKNVKACIALGGWDLGEGGGNDTAFERLAASSRTRATFITNTMKMVEDYHLDGVDIDWEYPDAGISSQYFDTLMTDLGKALHAKGKILTAAVVLFGPIGDGIPTSVFTTVDFINIMAYDNQTPPHSSFDVAQKALTYWLGKGLPKEKAILGVPFYGRPSKEDGAYKSLVARDKAAPFKDEIDGCFYNGLTTMRAKTTLALEQGGGIMIWELASDTNDSTSLLKAIREVIRKY